VNEELSAGERLSKWMGDQIKTRETVLSNGSAKTFEEYREICGVIKGLQMAKTELDDMMNNWKIASDLDD
jgi:hypothetical protein